MLYDLVFSVAAAVVVLGDGVDDFVLSGGVGHDDEAGAPYVLGDVVDGVVPDGFGDRDEADDDDLVDDLDDDVDD